MAVIAGPRGSESKSGPSHRSASASVATALTASLSGRFAFPTSSWRKEVEYIRNFDVGIRKEARKASGSTKTLANPCHSAGPDLQMESWQ